MKQLPNFELSIIIPLYCCLDKVKPLSPSNVKYYERNGIEVVVVADKSVVLVDILDYIYGYPFISWKVVVCNEEGLWQKVGKILNVGIRHATKEYILITNPEQEFYTDVIYELREKLDFYPEHYAVGQTLSKDIDASVAYGNIMAKKEYFEWIGGYCEDSTDWNIENEHLMVRLELAGIRRLFFPDAVVVSPNNISLRAIVCDEQIHSSQMVFSEKLLPTESNVNGTKWGDSYNTVAYDWKDHPFAKQQCRDYLSTFKRFDISSDEVFEKAFPLIALIPAYNESEQVLACLRSVEKYCDGIILLDDDSMDNTYQIAQSEKLLVKVKKCRTEFNDKQNRNILLDIASFFKAEWFIFLDADERFDDRFMDIKEVMERSDVDTAGVWIVNLWNSMHTYRVDMEDTNPNSKNGLWFRGRIFRNKGWMQIHVDRKLHFTALPYWKESKVWKSKTLLLHLGYLDRGKRLDKYNFYQVEDCNRILSYDAILSDKCHLENVSNLSLVDYE